MMKSRLLLLLVSLLVFGFVIDDELLKKILTQLQKHSTEYPQEKVHLHFDKPYYTAGDSIWFKGYVITAEQNKLSDLSKILYVELIDEQDSIVQSLRLPLALGLASGTFSLPDTLQEGNYRVRAYTQWMRNFSEEYFFDKTVLIGNVSSGNITSEIQYTCKEDKNRQLVLADIHYKNLDGNPLVNTTVNYTIQQDAEISHDKGITDSNGNLKITFKAAKKKAAKITTILQLDNQRTVSKSFSVKAASSDSDVQFFPEGGDLVAGIRSIVAFKATGSNGLGIGIIGSVTDQNNNKVAEIKSEHAGMGVFILYPQAEQVYSASIRFADGSNKTFILPKVLPQGYGLSAENTDPDNLDVKISVTPELISGGEITLLAQSNGVVKYVSKTIMDKSLVRARIPKNRFPTGIIQLTLFSPDQQPVAERLVFINNKDELNININILKTSYGKREKVKMTVDVKDADSKPVTGSFSLAVTDETKVPYDENNETTIISNLLLTSDLKGYIERPNYYFTDINESKLRQLDLLLMTQGWSRFEWKNILTNVFPALTFKPEKGIEVTGRVTSLLTGKPVVNGKVGLLPLSDTDLSLLSDTVTDAEGRFKFENLFFMDSTKFSIQARNAKDRKNTEIKLDKVPAQPVTGSKNPIGAGINVNLSLVAYVKNTQDQVEELKRYGLFRKNIALAEVKVVDRKKEELSYNLDRYGTRIGKMKVLTSTDLQNCMNLLMCVPAKGGGIIARNGAFYSYRGTRLTVILDGVPVLFNDDIESINAQDVENIIITTSSIVIITKHGELTPSTRYIPGITSYTPKGYYKERVFYSPNYDNPKVNNRMRDLRTTIFWAPHVLTDSTGKTTVEFFNADGTGNYRAIIEGIDLNGKMGRKVYQYSVR